MDGATSLLLCAAAMSAAWPAGGADGETTSLRTPAASLSSGADTHHFGRSATTAGDVDGDGLDDLVIGAPGDTGSVGEAHVYLGSSGGVSPEPTTTVEGDERGDEFGAEVSGVGDVNNDGYDDVVVARPGWPGGEVYLHLGGAHGVSTVPDATLDGGGTFGASVAGAGDLDGDGFHDVIVGASGAGAVVYFGDEGGLDASRVVVLEDPSSRAYFGHWVSGAGDVNGDGYDDVLVAAPDNGTRAAVHVYYGSATGISTTPDVTLTEGSYRQWGHSPAGAGDLDGDGFDEVIVGGYGDDDTQIGEAYVYAGSAAGLSTVATTSIFGTSVDGLFGDAVAGAGDVNGDGYDDVIVGAPGQDGYVGAAYLFYGSSGGLDVTAPVPLSTPAGTFAFGDTVSTAGDLNGDGLDDVVVAEYCCALSRRVFVYLGCADADGDGACAPDDCADGDATRSPVAEERCDPDDVDEDCDGSADDDDSSASGQAHVFPDEDGDGYGSRRGRHFCDVPEGWVGDSGDCDDTDASISPGAGETCNGVDDDCDLSIDEPPGDCDDADAEAPVGAGGGGGRGAPPESGGCACGSPSRARGAWATWLAALVYFIRRETSARSRGPAGREGRRASP